MDFVEIERGLGRISNEFRSYKSVIVTHKTSHTATFIV